MDENILQEGACPGPRRSFNTRQGAREPGLPKGNHYNFTHNTGP